MLHFLESISITLSATGLISTLSMMVLFVWILSNSIPKKRLEISIFQNSVLIVIATFFIGSFAVERYRSHYIMDKFWSFLGANGARVEVAGSNIDRYGFALDFDGLTTRKQSGSSPTKSLYVTISTSNGSIEMLLRRDSRDKDLYWVFYPGFPYKGNLGYFKTDLLAGIAGSVQADTSLSDDPLNSKQ